MSKQRQWAVVLLLVTICTMNFTHLSAVFETSLTDSNQQIGRDDLIESDAPGRCPELIEAARYVSNANTSELKKWRVIMLQMVGSWEDKESEEAMNSVYLHNAYILERHGIPSMLISQPVHSEHRNLAPPYWKMEVIQEHCTKADLIWFMDGDAIIMDPYARIEFLWAYHTYGNDPLDILFAHDWNDYNSGIFVVNCNSPTAMVTLSLWQQVAKDLLQRSESVHKLWYEQNALHYFLDTPSWQNTNGTTKWNDVIDQYPLIAADRANYTTEAFQTRLRHTTQCSLNTYPNITGYSRLARNSSIFVYSPGHFILHTAGARNVRLKVLTKYAKQRPASGLNHSSTLQDAAEAYLQSHPYDYDFNETFIDW